MKLLDNKVPTSKIIIVWSNQDEMKARKYYIDVKKSLISVSIKFGHNFDIIIQVCFHNIFLIHRCLKITHLSK